MKKLLLIAVLFAACKTPTADLELDAAQKLLDDARRQKANNCAKETYQAAEAALAAARQLAADKKIEEAKAKAAEASTLAEQAKSASPAGCDEPKPAEPEVDPNANINPTENIGAGMRLEDALETIYFDYNDATIREDSKAVLSKVANLLRTSGDKIEIEGHCDVRGSTEYNLHLGERRARAVQKYLMAQGVKESQLALISYGEERPVDFGSDDAAHGKNRRAELKKQ